MRTFLHAKIHRAQVTESNLDYDGSITIDKDLLDAAGIHEYEQVHVWNVTNGSRLVTYAIAGKQGSGVICINGAGAHLNSVGDLVIIAAFSTTSSVALVRIVLLETGNKIKSIITT